ncbi:MAG: hypothetical protein EF813_04565 [Methanosarcinales archaeon]|nr:MAG: hypothetical protein EF813_04565 [Methanosarcinales archaeon]
MGRARLNKLIERAVLGAKEISGINYTEEVSIHENINGFVANVYFRILRSTGNPIKIKLNMAAPEKQEILLPLETKEIIHLYSDDFHARIQAYSLEEIMAEKMRALFERTRPRDLYDVRRLHNEVDYVKVLNILYEKCRVKDVEIDVRFLEDRRDDFASAWTNSLQHQIKMLPNFDDVLHEVKRQITGLL